MAEDFTVHIEKIKEGDRARHVKGHILLQGRKFLFTSLVLDTHGGPTIGARFTKKAQVELRKTGFTKDEVDDLTVSLQMKMLDGDMVLPGREPRNQAKSSFTIS